MMRGLAELAEAEERREAVRAAAAKFLQGEWSLARLRECVERDGRSDSPTLLEGMRKLDWDRVEPFESPVSPEAPPEAALSVGEFCAVVEETGSALAPTALVSGVVARSLLRAAGANVTATLPVLARGEADRSSDPSRTTVVATQQDHSDRLDGCKRFVPYGMEADVIVVNASQSDGSMALYAVDADTPGVERSSLALLDSSPCAEIRFLGATLSRSARIASGSEAMRLFRDAVALETLTRCAELVGVASRALELAVDYAKQRIAFDRPIGSFQAVQHRLVNLRGSVEVARALYRGAAGDMPAEERPVAISMAAFAALDELRKVPEGALQVFGGIGTTWEHDIHFFLRRAATLCALLGERAGFREDVARHLTAAD